MKNLMSPLKRACNPNKNDSAEFAWRLNEAVPSARRPKIDKAKEKQVTIFPSTSPSVYQLPKKKV